MWAKYEYAPGSTVGNVLADIVLILTGTTNKALLSAACVQANTEIISTVVAGWTVHDASAGTNAKALKALNLDGSTYKYCVIGMDTANKLFCKVYESWNATAHTGGNLAYLSDAIFEKIDLTNGGVLYISTSARGIVIHSLVAGVWGEVTYGYAPIGILERSRAAPWDTVANGYPPYVSFNLYFLGSSYYSEVATYNCWAPRIKGLTGDRLTTTAYLKPITEFGFGLVNPTLIANVTMRNIIPAIRGYDGTMNLKHFMHEIGLFNYTEAYKAGKILGNIFLTTANFGAAGDVIVHDGNNYFIMTENTSNGTGAGLRLAVPKY